MNSELSQWQLNEYIDMKPGLSRIRTFLSRIGDPQKRFRSVLVTGTNGKGSTAKILSEILKASGYKTGLYTSPHLVNITERIRIDSRDISKNDFEYLTGKYLPLARKLGLTFFEFITAVAFIYFSKEKIDIAVLEIGLGGRFDAVNVVDDPLLSIITDVDLDHCSILGNDLASIAFEKAGIIKKNGCVVSGVEKKPAKNVIRKTANIKKALLFEFKKDFNSKIRKVDWKSGLQYFSYFGINDKIDLKMSLLGLYQIKNGALAIASAEILKTKGFNIDLDGIKTALEGLKWPGRFDVRANKGKTLILDGAHNPGAINKFLETFKKSPWGKRKQTFIFAMMKDKECKSVIKYLAPYAKKVILVPVASKRSLPQETAFKYWNEFVKEENIMIANSVEEGLRKAGEEKVMVAAGSLYLVGEILKKGGKYDKTIFRD